MGVGFGTLGLGVGLGLGRRQVGHDHDHGYDHGYDHDCDHDCGCGVGVRWAAPRLLGLDPRRDAREGAADVEDPALQRDVGRAGDGGRAALEVAVEAGETGVRPA